MSSYGARSQEHPPAVAEGDLVHPPKGHAKGVAPMEAVLDVYQRPPAPRRPLQPAHPGQPRRYDVEYQRAGARNVFLAGAPLAGRRYVTVMEQRTRTDWAAFMRELADPVYPTAERIGGMLDNPHMHGPASSYTAYPPAEARRLAQRFEVPYLPKHGSRLNVAEIELSVLIRQCLDRRMGVRRRWRPRWPLGPAAATPPRRPLTASSRPPTPGSSSSLFTHHWTHDGLVAQVADVPSGGWRPRVARPGHCRLRTASGRTRSRLRGPSVMGHQHGAQPIGG